MALDRSPSRFFLFCAQQNQKFEQFLRKGSEQNAGFAGITVAMLLGKKSALSHEQKAIFLATGVMHLFAISGLHVGMIALILFQFLSLLRWPRPVL